MSHPLRLEYVDPSTLGPNPRNWRVHGEAQRATFEGCLAEVGWADALLFNERTGRLLDGHMRRDQAIANRLEVVPVLVGDWDEATEAKILATKDNLGAMATIDPRAFDSLIREIDTGCPELMELLNSSAEAFGVVPTDKQVRKAVRDELAALDGDDDELDDDTRVYSEPGIEAPPPATAEDDQGVPDVVFPGDNDWDVPTLDKRFMADFPDFPCTVWGSIGRGKPMQGTYFFYTDDSRFKALWKDPSVILKSGCRNIVEPNFSTHELIPRFEMLHRIARKRWLARWAQTQGIRVFVDLNVHRSVRDLNLLGVPKGWLSWATRAHSGVDGLEEEYALAVERAGTELIVFVVYGGGKPVKALCAERGWHWVPEQSDVAKGKEQPHGVE